VGKIIIAVGETYGKMAKSKSRTLKGVQNLKPFSIYH
jgi:hypothetical protein